MNSIQTRYVQTCKELGIHPNKHIRDKLFAVSSPTDITSIDVSVTMISSKGFTALISLLPLLPNLTSLNVSANNVSAEAVSEAIPIWKAQPALTSINLASNHIPMAGQPLYEFVKKCNRITKLDIENTAIRPMFARLIDIWLRKNNGESITKESIDANKGLAQDLDVGQDVKDREAPGGDESFTFGDKEIEPNSDKDALDVTLSPRLYQMKRTEAVSNEVITAEALDNFVPRVVPKSDEDKKWAYRVFESHPLFAHLEDYELGVVVDALEGVGPKNEGEELSSPGHDTYFLIRTGSVVTAQGTLKAGDGFGDRSLLHEAPLDGQCTIGSTPTILYALDREHYQCIVQKSCKKKREQYVNFLKGISFLKNMGYHELVQLADALKGCQFADGEKLISYGEEGTWFYIIREGSVKVLGRDETGDVATAKEVCTFTVGACVGELEFINSHKCVADVIAQGFVRAAKMHKHHFEMCMGPVKDFLKEIAEKDEQYSYYRQKIK